MLHAINSILQLAQAIFMHGIFYNLFYLEIYKIRLLIYKFVHRMDS